MANQEHFKDHPEFSIFLKFFEKIFGFHPEMKKEINIGQFIALYAWHGEHHLGHLQLLKDA